MKLLRLDLRAFGPFTDRVLDFGAAGAADSHAHPHPNLHLIYGANEAGKSSALRALGDLRFGIPMRSNDDFIHPYAQLRVGAVFEAPAVLGVGPQLVLTRRKGQGQTLALADATTGEALPGALPAGLLPWLTEGLDRERFEAMFCLNHERLRQGGRDLIEGRGELGAALFAASAGSQSVRQLLDTLDAEARRYHAPRASQSVMAQARAELDEARKTLRDATTRPQAWKELQRQAEHGAEQLAQAQTQLAECRREELRLSELRSVAPLLQRRDQLAQELAGLAALPPLPADAAEQRRTAQRERAAARDEAQQAEAEIARCTRELARLAPDAGLLHQAEVIRRLATELAALQQAEAQVAAQQTTQIDAEARLARDLQRIAPGRSADALLAGLPGAAAAAALRARADHLAEALQQHATRAEALHQREQEAAELAQADSVAPPPQQLAALQSALAQWRALGDVAPRLQALQRELGATGQRLAQDLAELGLADEAALTQARLLLDALIQQERSAFDQLARQRADIEPEQRRLNADLAEQRQRAQALQSGGELVSAATLAQAREQRDATWRMLRARYIDRQATAAAMAPAVATDPAEAGQGEPAAAFEAALRRADQQADLLQRDAERAAQWAECQLRISQMDERLAELGRQDAALQHTADARQADWQARLQAAGLPLLAPAVLAEWQLRVQALRERAGQRRGLDADLALLVTQCRQAGAALAAALGAGPMTPFDVATLAELSTDLAALGQRAATMLQDLEARQAAQQERARQQATLARRLDAARQQLEQARDTLAQARAACAADARTLWLADTPAAASDRPADLAPAVLRARLDELAAFERTHAECQRLQLARQAAEQRAARLAAAVADLADRLGEAAPARPDDAIRRLERRLLDAQEAERQRTVLLRERDAALERLQRAQAMAAGAAQCLQQLCVLAAGPVAAATGRDDVAVSEADLPALEDQLTHRRELQRALALLDQQLAQAASRPLETLRAELAGCDLAGLDAQRLQAELAGLQADQALQAARSAEHAARQALDAIDASARAADAREAIEQAAARWRDAVRPWARLRLAHALLDSAMRRFRERAQAPMLGVASRLFATMTGGRYTRLRVDDTDGRPVLLAERAAPAQATSALAARPELIGVEAMSEGTADQLYLALRLAALNLRQGTFQGEGQGAGAVMPLVLDDVLMTSDDERAVCVLQALADHARSGQVLLFTHHRHLIELARAWLDSSAFAVHLL